MIASSGFDRGLVAALALRADRINMGPRLICNNHRPIHLLIKDKVVANDAREAETLIRVRGRLGRMIADAPREAAE